MGGSHSLGCVHAEAESAAVANFELARNESVWCGSEYPSRYMMQPGSKYQSVLLVKHVFQWRSFLPNEHSSFSAGGSFYTVKYLLYASTLSGIRSWSQSRFVRTCR